MRVCDSGFPGQLDRLAVREEFRNRRNREYADELKRAVAETAGTQYGWPGLTCEEQ